MSLVRNCIWLSKLHCRNQVTSRFLNQQKLYFSSQVDPEILYTSPKVQELLKKITGFDLDKILKAKPVAEPAPPTYKLLTDEQLQKVQEEAIINAQKYVQMPPFKKAMDVEATKNQILSKDEEIYMFEKEPCSYVFADISTMLHKRERSVVVREFDGTLRLADLHERDRILQVFYPEPGKTIKMPEMFKEERLEELLCPENYAYILDRSLMQFEPDDPNYVRVTQRTYEHILSTKQFDLFRSTRHFGPMSFYYLLYNKIDGLLCDMLSRDLIDDAVHLVQLYCLVHPESGTSKQLQASEGSDQFKAIRTYLENDSKDKVVLELTLNSYLTRLEEQTEQKSSSN